MGESAASSASEVLTPSRALLKMLEDCGVRTLAATYEYLRDGVADPLMRELTDDLVETSLRQIARIVEALRPLVEGVSHEREA